MGEKLLLHPRAQSYNFKFDENGGTAWWRHDARSALPGVVGSRGSPKIHEGVPGVVS